MPSTKGRGGAGSSPVKRYRPASEYDDATLAQKREYWRTKKREQRARLTDRRGRPKQDSRRDKSLPKNTSVALTSGYSSSRTASAPLLNIDGSYKKGNVSTTSLGGNRAAGGSVEASVSQKEKWFQRIKLNKVLPHFPVSNSRSAKAAAVNATSVKCLTPGGAVSGSVTSPKLNGALSTSSSSVPPVRVTVQPSGLAPRQPQCRMNSTNGSSSLVIPQPCTAMQGASAPKAQSKAQVTVQIQPAPTTSHIPGGIELLSSPSAPLLIAVDGKAGNTPQVGKQSALVTSQRGRGFANASAATPESEEERAARRREHWRIKKREQRAKQANQLAKARERSQSTDALLQKQTLQRAGHAASLPSSMREPGPRQYMSRVKTPFTSAGRLLKNARVTAASTSLPKVPSIVVKKENEDLKSSAARITTTNLNKSQQTVRIKVEDPQIHKKTEPCISPTATIDRRLGETSRKLPVHMQVSNRGIARCRTPRQRFIEAQRTFLGQRNVWGKSLSLSNIYTTRNVPKVDPNETPEQQVARKREYWRIKKREQRAKLSSEVKAKLKEKDSLMRRVKRYQSILEEMRRARAEACNTVTQPMGSTLTHASETIGGFIKEDGTVTINIPHVQSSCDSATVAGRTGGELCTYPDSNANSLLPHQRHASPAGNAPRNVLLGDPIRINPPPPPLRPAQVKVSFPHAGQPVNKPPRLLSVRPRAEVQSTSKGVANSHRVVVHTPSQITLRHPEALQKSSAGAFPPGLTSGSCVMKMAVTSSSPLIAPSLSAITLDPELTEEEKMAKKREYWRVKKREQRAARTARLKQGLLQARVNAALQRRRVQRLAPLQQRTVTSVRLSTTFTKPAVNIQPISNTSVPLIPQANEIKQESESTPAVDLNSQEERAICPDIKPPPSPPRPQPEPDPALNVDSQATTLLAVASMKKLLEESLSTVAECTGEEVEVKKEQLHCKTEPEACVQEQASEQEMKPDIPHLLLGEEGKPSPADDLTLDKSWQSDADAQVLARPPSPNLKNSPPSSESLPLPLSCADTFTQPPPDPHVPEHACFCASAEPSDGLDAPFPRRAQRLRDKKAGHQPCCSQEPPKLHHPPLIQAQPRELSRPPRGQGCERQYQPPSREQQQAQRSPAGADQSPASSLQKKREYWKLMKRQQRARSKAGQKNVQPGEYGRRQNTRGTQASNVAAMKTTKPAHVVSPQQKPLLQTRPPVASLTAVTSIPTLLVVSPTTSNVGQPPDTLQVKPPIRSVCSLPTEEHDQMHFDPTQTCQSFSAAPLPGVVGGGGGGGGGGDDDVSDPLSDNGMDGQMLLVENQQGARQRASADAPRVRKWTLRMPEGADVDSASTLPTLTPPDNPLSSIKLLPIEPRTPPRTSTLSPIKIPCSQPLSPQGMRSPPTKLVPISTMVPPKPIPGESEEDFLRRKREYWRVKKKEQRARKAMRDRELTQRRASNNWRPIRPAEDQLQGAEAEDCGQLMNTSEDPNQLMSSSSEADLGYYPYSNYTAPIEEESDVMFDPYHNNGGDMDDAIGNINPGNSEDGGGGGEYEGALSDSAWRSRYLMDHDPLNQLLVCMVCGDLQYSHSLEGVRAHIEEAHPDTLDLEAPERRRILEAWDEQVSQRERFFTSQLQQHSGALAEAQRH